MPEPGNGRLEGNIALPGMIKTGNMRRWSVALGRCHLCDTGPIVWFDPVEYFGLCETCYARECSGVGGASERSERATGMSDHETEGCS